MITGIFQGCDGGLQLKNEHTLVPKHNLAVLGKTNPVNLVNPVKKIPSLVALRHPHVWVPGEHQD
jgi:hypothetical protein